MTNRSDDDEMAREFNASIRLERLPNAQDAQDAPAPQSPSPQPSAPQQPQLSVQETSQMINDLRVQIVEMLETQKATVAVAAATASTSSAIVDTNITAIEDGRYCWVCFATDEDDKMAAWVQPCKCSGTTKWVHQVCSFN